MEQRVWDMWVDFARVYEGGLTYGHLDDAAPGVAQVIEIRPDGIVLLRVLPGHADLHRQLLQSRTA